MSEAFEQGAAAGAGIFGLETGPGESLVHVLGVPFDATCSYGRGSYRGPEAVLRASRQVDLFDLEYGKPFEVGIFMPEVDPEIAALNESAVRLAQSVRGRGSLVEGDDRGDLARVNDICEAMNERVYAATSGALEAGKIVGLVGGDHSVAFGSLRAHAERFPGIGVLQFDAHADLRVAYEGFTWSHASILHNALEQCAGIAKLVAVGVRDLCEEEHDAIRDSGGRIDALFDTEWSRARLEGRDLGSLIREKIELLPRDVYVTFDVDGLDPSLCPNTGTPVPGGLLWHEATAWLRALVDSGRRVVGFDVNEVNPLLAEARERDSLDAIVGARLLYKLVGASLASRGTS